MEFVEALGPQPRRNDRGDTAHDQLLEARRQSSDRVGATGVISSVLKRLPFFPRGCTIAFTNVEPAATHSEREWILIGMAGSCAAKGFEETTVADICAAAGVSRESFERVFADTDECLGAAMESLVEEAWRRLEDVRSPVKPWAAVLRDATIALLDLLAERPAFAHVALIEAPVARGRAGVLYASTRAALLAQIELGQGQAPAGVPASAARGALAGAETLATGHVLAGKTRRLAVLAPDVVYLLAVPYLGQTEAQRLAAESFKRPALRAVA